MAERAELEFTYSLIDRIFRIGLGELADFSGAKYDGDFSLPWRRRSAASTITSRSRSGSRPDAACWIWAVAGARCLAGDERCS
jgi:hypothetical protein